MASVQKCIFEYFQGYSEECSDSRFLFDEQRSYTVEETFHEAIAIGNRLHDCGVKEGSLVGLRSTRSLDAYLIYLALQFMGATVILTDPHQNAEDFVRDTGIAIATDVIVTNERASEGLAANGNWEIIGHGALEIGYPARREKRQFAVGKNLKAPSTIVFTSGSTGKSKGSMLSQEALLQYAEDSIVYDWHLPDDIAIVTLPTQHGFALCLLIAAFVARYALFFPKDMHVEYVLDCIERYQITRMNGVPSFFYVMARVNEAQNKNVKSLRTGFVAGAPIIPEQHRYVEQVLGMTLHPLYGMSEGISISCTSPLDSAETRATTVGKFHRNAGCIVDADGNELPNGLEGEICFSGSALMCGYYGDEKATKQVFDEKGRFHTGDLGYIDEKGYLHISGRKKDIIIRNGVNLSPAKIEAAIRSVSQVEDAVVVGVRHEMLGEAPCALVVVKKGISITPEELRVILLQRMPKNEVPLTILFAKEIPLNKIGKPDKQEIKKMFFEWKA